MSHVLFTGSQFTMLGAAIGLVRYGLGLPPSWGRMLIRLGAIAALIEAVLWVMGVLG